MTPDEDRAEATERELDPFPSGWASWRAMILFAAILLLGAIGYWALGVTGSIRAAPETTEANETAGA